MRIDPEQQWESVEIGESLAGRKPGTGALDKARELREGAWVQALYSRLRRIDTPERAWSKGALGEKVAGFWLSRLSEGWHVFHDVSVGERGANIDHVAIGPGGVYTINTKYLTGAVVVSAEMIRVSGHATDFLPLARHEARRASKLLGAALGRSIDVTPILTFVVDEFGIKDRPEGVAAVRVGGLKQWLETRESRLAPAEVTAISAVAHKPTTWTSTQVAEAPPKEEASCACGGSLVVRVRRSDGAHFWGCSRFPTCRRTVSITP